jgi:hypothetical protein
MSKRGEGISHKEGRMRDENYEMDDRTLDIRGRRSEGIMEDYAEMCNDMLPEVEGR